MTPIAQILHIPSEYHNLLQQAGVVSAELLAQAEGTYLTNLLTVLAEDEGINPPADAHVRTWIHTAKESLGIESELDAADLDIMEAISMDEVPEVLIEGKANLPRGRSMVPDILGAPMPRQMPPLVNRTPDFLPKAGGEGLAPQLPPILRSEERRLSPAERAMHSMGRSELDSDSHSTTLAAMPPEQNQQKGGKRRFQSFNEYQDGGRGIVPLERKLNPIAPEVEEEKRRSDGSLGRTTRRGVVYPNPLRAVIGAIISLAWRLGVIVSIVGLPYLVFNTPKGAPPPVKQALPWLGCLLLMGVFQLFILDRTRCRICTCHLFYSKRCIKNTKAHYFALFGYVASLCLHMLIFQWFRCMYCGTAIRLTPGKE
jgi:hypothetical protein